MKGRCATRKAVYRERLSTQTFYRNMVVLILTKGISDHYLYCYRRMIFTTAIAKPDEKRLRVLESGV